ncbi:MAG: hypothetical protein KatS3mg008_1928 [Acidimicrobiales bacterium]|nr:MAG: hypothetical protein KatS3mg008_1928 [Acidimicrobiales bacterium]
MTAGIDGSDRASASREQVRATWEPGERAPSEDRTVAMRDGRSSVRDASAASRDKDGSEGRKPRKLLGRAERREQILRAAARAFGREGYAATSMEDVAAEAGVTKLIVYRHFDSKEALYRAVLERISGRLREEFLAQMKEGEPGFATRALLTVARQEPEAVRLLWVHAMREPEFLEYVAAARREATELAHEMIGDDIADPSLKSWAAETLVSYLVTSVLAWMDHGDPAADEDFVRRSTAGLVALYTAWKDPSSTGFAI